MHQQPILQSSNLQSSNLPHILGIRHHGPGSARSVREALDKLQPDIVLVEGPPDANEQLRWLAHPDTEPPVALIVYRPDEPGRAAYYPFAIFSPELQAIRYAYGHDIPARFMDLPQSHLLNTEAKIAMPDGDPLQQLAKAAGYPQYETWWNLLVEQRQNRDELFPGILELMSAVRATATQQQTDEAPLTEPEARAAQQLAAGRRLADQREAYMRQSIRQAQAAGHERIAIVCGAWHGPALQALDTFEQDEELLADLSEIEVETAWVPWTYSRLSYRTGYGAGIASPGWYHHLWDMGQQQATISESSTHWLTQVASLLREEGFDASSAHIIEAVRLAEAVAAVRETPFPGLAELNEATQAIMCFGDATPLRLIQERLIISERMGSVPPDTPLVPLQRNLLRLQKELKLRPQPEKSTLKLDLRNEMHLARSHLLHRLNLLKIPWGKTLSVRGQQGTYREIWQLQWVPDYAVRVIEANLWGNTVEEAAAGYAQDAADKATNLSALTQLLDQIILADLPDTISHVMKRIEDEAALSSDILLLCDALPPLAQVLRYGSVRQTDQSMVQQVVDGLLTRIWVGLPSTCANVDDNAATEIYKRITTIDGVVNTLQNDDHRSGWHEMLTRLADQRALHGLLAGRACRLLLDARVFSPDEAKARLERVLSGQTILATSLKHLMQVAFWLEGFLKGSGLLLLHDQNLWQLLDRWINQLEPEEFINILPLLRRTFASFDETARQQISERVRYRQKQPTEVGLTPAAFDAEQAEAALPLLRQLLGVTL